MKIAVIQIDVTRDKKANLEHAEQLIRQASQKADFIVLPEMFNCPYNAKTFMTYAEAFPGETTNLLENLAKELDLLIVGGSIPELEADKIFNTSFIYGPEGLIGKHRKAHLFDVDIKGGITFKESDVLHPGHRSTVLTYKDITFGVCICYDMRFPELARTMVNQGAEMIIVPAAFNTTTGPAHWHITARARAVDNQVYFVVASPARSDYLSYKAYGHSLIVNPWGTILSEADILEEIIYADIDREYIKKIRSELPLLNHRRHELYDC